MSLSRAYSYLVPAILFSSALTFGPDAQAVEPYVAEVTATEVNVRSGPSTNYYIVTKLQAGDRVEVREEEEGWFGIIPTPGCFSLISKHYVDLDGDGSGVVNGNSVRVRAGSSRSASRYAVQVKLNEGDVVEVISEGPEGYLKIKPPKGAYIWIHGELVARVSQNRAVPERDQPSSMGEPSRTESVQTEVFKNDLGKGSVDSEPRSAMAPHSEPIESTDRVAVYTWTGEPGGKIRTTGSKQNATIARKTDPVNTLKVPSNISQSIPKSDPGLTPSAEGQAESNRSADVPPASVAQRPTGQRSTTRASQFSDDSTDQVAIIKWDDASSSAPSPATVPRNSPSVQAEPTFEALASPPINPKPLPSALVAAPAQVHSDTNTVTVIPYSGSDPRVELKLIDRQMVAELDKPIDQRQFGELMARYRGIMEADVDEASKQYAGRRIHQLEVLSIRLNAVGQMNHLVAEVVETRQSASVQRSSFIVPREQTNTAFDATGELRESMVFSSPVGPRRYRLIDPNESVPRTLCYVEVPRDSDIDVSRFLGRIVGVRSSRKFIETGNVDPISVLVASSIELVSRAGTAASPQVGTVSESYDADKPEQILTRPMVPMYEP